MNTRTLGLGVALAAALVPMALAAAALDLEPNDDFATAMPLKLPVASGTGCIDSPSDLDFYSLVLGEAGPLVVDLKPAGGEDILVALYDADQGLLSTGRNRIDRPKLAAGKYFLRLGAAARSCYELEILADSPVPPPFG